MSILASGCTQGYFTRLKSAQNANHERSVHVLAALVHLDKYALGDYGETDSSGWRKAVGLPISEESGWEKV
jgi:hypothetical protein